MIQPPPPSLMWMPYQRYMGFTGGYGLIRHAIYSLHHEDKQEKLFTVQLFKASVCCVTHMYAVPVAICEDIVNIERVIRKMKPKIPFTVEPFL